MRTRAGFTLFELLLVIAAMAVIALAAMPINQALYARNALRVGTTDAAQAFRRAQALARSGDGDSSWGVAFAPEGVVVFRGASYAARDAAFDEIVEMSSAVTITGPAEVVFAKFSGFPEATGTINILSANGETRTITINAYGALEE